MAPRSGLAVGDKAGGVTTDSAVDPVDGRDALGNEPGDVALEETLASDGGGTKEETNNEAAAEEAQRKKLGLGTFKDPRDELVAGFRARRAAERDGKPAPVGDELANSLDEQDDGGDASLEGDAAPGEVIIIGRDGKQRTEIAPAATETQTQRTEADPGDATSQRGRGARVAPADEGGDDDGIDPGQQVTMVVDGVKVRMTHAEMKRTAQMNLAAESRLRQANDLLDRARATVTDSASTRTAPTDRDQDRTAPRQETRTTPLKIDPSKVKNLVQKIQLGDDDEAAAALAEAISIGVTEGQAQGGQTSTGSRDVSSEVDDVLTRRAAETEINQALRTVAEEAPDIIGNRRLYPGAMVEAHAMAVENLRSIGVPEQDLTVPAMELFNGYARLRQDPAWRNKLPAMSDVFAGAAETVRRDVGLPEPPRREAQLDRDVPRLPTRAGQAQQTRIVRTADEDRSGRKGRVQVQPRSGSIRSDFSGNAVAPKRTPPSDVVNQMAKSRGQTVVVN